MAPSDVANKAVHGPMRVYVLAVLEGFSVFFIMPIVSILLAPYGVGWVQGSSPSLASSQLDLPLRMSNQITTLVL